MAAMKKAERAEGEDLSLSGFASRADRCDVQTKSGIRRIAWCGGGGTREARDEDGGCAHDGRDLPRLTRRKPFLMHFSCKRGNDVWICTEEEE